MFSLYPAFSARVQCDESKDLKDELYGCVGQCRKDHSGALDLAERLDEEEAYDKCEIDCKKTFFDKCIPACQKNDPKRSKKDCFRNSQICNYAYYPYNE